MNRYLEYSQNKIDTLRCKVQSKMELWWIGSTQELVESHEAPRWIFSHTTIPIIMER